MKDIILIVGISIAFMVAMLVVVFFVPAGHK